MRRMFGLFLMIASPAIAQVSDDDLANAAITCEGQRALRPAEVVPGSFFRSGWQSCDAMVEAWRKSAGGKADPLANKMRDQRHGSDKKKIDELSKKLPK